MAEHEFTHSYDHRNLLSRRRALQGAAAVGALAVPAAVALTIEATKLSAASAADDPLIAMWAERVEIVAKIGGDNFDDAPGGNAGLYVRMWDLENEIAATAPTSPEGLAIVATVLLIHYDQHREPFEHWGTLENDTVAGAHVARYVLATTPPDVLRRAGLEG